MPSRLPQAQVLQMPMRQPDGGLMPCASSAASSGSPERTVTTRLLLASISVTVWLDAAGVNVGGVKASDWKLRAIGATSVSTCSTKPAGPQAYTLCDDSEATARASSSVLGRPRSSSMPMAASPVSATRKRNFGSLAARALSSDRKQRSARRRAQ